MRMRLPKLWLASRRALDAEPPSFRSVLAGQTTPPARPRNWWPIITFVAVLVACLCLGLLIMDRVGVFGVGLPWSPDLIEAPEGAGPSLSKEYLWSRL
jgi:hypothetical protein